MMSEADAGRSSTSCTHSSIFSGVITEASKTVGFPGNMKIYQIFSFSGVIMYRKKGFGNKSMN